MTKHWLISALCAALLLPVNAFAHGERAQQANLRMRTVNWYDIEMSQTRLAVGEPLKISGRLLPSKFWPDHIPSVEGQIFLNVGTSGPNFIRISSSIDGVSMVQSSALQLGRDPLRERP